MDEAEKYKQRLEAIAEKRRLLDEQERAKREMEDERIRLQQLKRKSLRDQWLMEGPPLSPSSLDTAAPRSPLWGTQAQETEKRFEKLESQTQQLAEAEEKLTEEIEDGQIETVAVEETATGTVQDVEDNGKNGAESGEEIQAAVLSNGAGGEEEDMVHSASVDVLLTSNGLSEDVKSDQGAELFGGIHEGWWWHLKTFHLLLELLDLVLFQASPPTEQSTPPNCQELVQPLGHILLQDLEGKWTLVAGGLNSTAFLERFKTRESVFIEFVTINSANMHFTRAMNINESCHHAEFEITLRGSRFEYREYNLTITFLHSTCPDCLVGLFDRHDKGIRQLYLFSKRREVDKDELDEFKAQVECLKMPHVAFMDPTKELCPERNDQTATQVPNA